MTYHRLESLRPYFDAWNRKNARARREYRVWPLTVPGAKPQCVTGCGRGVQYRDAGKACAACVGANDSGTGSGVSAGHAGRTWENESGPDGALTPLPGPDPRYNSTRPRSEG